MTDRPADEIADNSLDERSMEPAASDRRRSGAEPLDRSWADGDVPFDADVDRLVERLYRKIERKQRIERKRRGL